MSDLKKLNNNKLIELFEDRVTYSAESCRHEPYVETYKQELRRRLPLWRNLDSCPYNEPVLFKADDGTIYQSFHNDNSDKDMNPYAIAWMPLNILTDAPMENNND